MPGFPEAETSLGVCIKSEDQVVEYQNPLCLRLCGNQIGLRCEKGCMEKICWPEDKAMALGFHHLKNVGSEKSQVDAVVHFDGAKITTFLHAKEQSIRRQFEKFKSFKLSKSELTIVSLVLTGLSNPDISKKLFISRSTLKTHLNNIYKKIPVNLKISLSRK
jgi:DNA-binding CsgD family transcriptional regulator